MLILTHEGKQERKKELAELETKVTFLDRDSIGARSAEHSLDQFIHHREPASFRSYKNLFWRYFCGVESAEIREPYLENLHQVSNLRDFLEIARVASDVLLNKAVAITQDSSRTERAGLESL